MFDFDYYYISSFNFFIVLFLSQPTKLIIPVISAQIKSNYRGCVLSVILTHIPFYLWETWLAAPAAYQLSYKNLWYCRSSNSRLSIIPDFVACLLQCHAGYYSFYIQVYQPISIMVRVFANRLGFNPASNYTKDFKWYLIPPCQTLSIIRYGSRIKWSNPGKE